jgi:hypothetical protein
MQELYEEIGDGKMRILYWSEKYEDDNKRNVIRGVTDAQSLKDFAIDHLHQLFIDKLFQNTPECSIEIYKRNAQIRIPETEYNLLRPEIKHILTTNSIHIKNDSLYKDIKWSRILEIWRKTNYWTPCRTYIFDFNTHVIKLDSENELCGERVEIGFMQSIHPFIDEFIDCMESRWGEADEIQNIKKWKI